MTKLGGIWENVTGTPEVIDLTAGVWNGDVTIHQEASNVRIRIQSNRTSGISQLFNISGIN